MEIMLNNVVLMFFPTDEKTPYEQGENASLKTVNYHRIGIYPSFKQKVSEYTEVVQLIDT